MSHAGVLSGDLFDCGLVIKKENLAKLSDVNDNKKLTEKNEQNCLFKKHRERVGIII